VLLITWKAETSRRIEAGQLITKKPDWSEREADLVVADDDIIDSLTGLDGSD
jgi:hypothetical protein